MKNLRLIAILPILLLSAVTAQALNKEYEISIALKRISVLGEFRETWSSSTFNLYYKHGSHYIEGRVLLSPNYLFQIHQRVQRPEVGKRLEPIAEADFTLYQIEEIKVDDDGRFVPELTRLEEFGLPTWLELYRAGGKFKAIGIDLQGGPPLSRIEGYNRQIRQEADY